MSTGVNTQDWNQLWDKYADSAQKNPAQEYRRQLIFSLLKIPGTGKGSRVLDVGSGQGDFSLSLKKQFPDVEILGLELSRSGVEISKKKVPTAHFVEQDLMVAHEIPDKFRGWATHAVSSEMLEHVDEPERVLENIKPYLAAACRFVITVPGGPMSEFDKHIGHRQHFTKATFDQLLKKAGYASVTTLRSGFPFMNLYRLAVIARGKKLIADVARGDGEEPGSFLARLAMKGFSFVFPLNTKDSPWGWQIVSVAKKQA